MQDLCRITRALISVFDKSGLIELAQFLTSRNVEIISTGGTARFLLEHGIHVIPIEEITQAPEILDGRVKTISSRVFASLLFDRAKPHHRNTIEELAIAPIDLLVVNLYPFAAVAANADASIASIIEHIDVGGPAMLRAAAKNYHSLTVLSHPSEYSGFMSHCQNEDGSRLSFRKRCATCVFATTAAYDEEIARVFAERIMEEQPREKLHLTLPLERTLRYGENPHQRAALYRHDDGSNFDLGASITALGKEVSYNNLLDANSALWSLRNLVDFQASHPSSAVIIKHGIPCGAAQAFTPADALAKAIASDPKSAFGGIIAINETFTLDCCHAIADGFFELILAPSFSQDAWAHLSQRKNLRLVAIDNLSTGPMPQKFIRSICGGILVEDFDTTKTNAEHWSVVTEKLPTKDEMRALDFAFRVVKTVPSNAITVSSSDQLFGVGAGQPNRIQSVELALSGAHARGFDLTRAALASDAFFPFDDGIKLAHSFGVRLIIQPGGSIRDKDVIAKANELGMAMVFTHQRHFRH